jgi:hypothetical protein
MRLNNDGDTMNSLETITTLEAMTQFLTVLNNNPDAALVLIAVVALITRRPPKK